MSNGQASEQMKQEVQAEMDKLHAEALKVDVALEALKVKVIAPAPGAKHALVVDPTQIKINQIKELLKMVVRLENMQDDLKELFSEYGDIERQVVAIGDAIDPKNRYSHYGLMDKAESLARDVYGDDEEWGIEEWEANLQEMRHNAEYEVGLE